MRTVLLAATLVAGTAPASATATAETGGRIGTEFPISPDVGGDQRARRILPTSDGFAVVSGDLIRRFSALGVPQGPTFSLASHLFTRAIAATPSGGFVVVGSPRILPVPEHPRLVFQRLDALGNPLAAPVEIAIPAQAQIQDADVGVDDDGDIVVAWAVDSTFYDPFTFFADVNLDSLFARRYDSNGQPRGARIRIGTTGGALGSFGTRSQFGSVKIAVDHNGSFLVGWTVESRVSDVRYQRYTAQGLPLGAVQQVGLNHLGFAPAVALHNGAGAIAWQTSDGLAAGSGSGIRLQRVGALGLPLGLVIKANTYLPGEQSEPTLAISDAGDAIVGWSSGTGSVVDAPIAAGSQDGSGYGVYLRRFPLRGEPGPEVLVNTVTDEHQFAPQLACSNGHLLAAWTSGHFGDIVSTMDLRLFGQLFEGC